EICVGTECTCYKATGTCYVKCAEDLDCSAKQTCDTKTHVCVLSSAECNNDSYCVQRDGFGSTCVEGTCAFVCDDDNDCPGTLNGVKLFCTVPVVEEIGDSVHSAITD